MIEFTLAADSSAPAEDVLAAAREFSRRRLAIWPNVSARRFEVHASGETFVEATESALQGLFWERSRYEWPQPGSVHQTVLDSNVLRPGSTWEITAVPNGDGSHVECVFRREFTLAQGAVRVDSQPVREQPGLWPGSAPRLGSDRKGTGGRRSP